MFVLLTRLGRVLVGSMIVVALTAIVGFNALDLVPAANHNSANGSSLSLVLENSTDGQPHWGQTVTFKVSTGATTQPNVSLDCYQNGVLVYGAVAGFYAGYPWPGSQNFILSSPSWTGGGASCTASLYYFSGRKTVTLTNLNFQVYS
jgi:hypothetical protein